MIVADLVDSTLHVSYTAESYRCYPGEMVKLWLTVTPGQPISDQVMVRVCLPDGLTPILKDCRSPKLDVPVQLLPETDGRQQKNKQPRNQDRTIFWQLEAEKLEVNKPLEFFILARAGFPGTEDLFLRSWAEVVTIADENGRQRHLASDVITIQILARAKILKYLPEIYHHEDHALMWRYLMVFDRIWSYYDEFFTNQAAYFDPHLTPEGLLICLASWVGLGWDEQAPKTVQMRVIPDLTLKMVELHQKRGTADGLIKYLQIWMGVADEDVSDCIQIHENVAGNFILSDQTALNNQLVIGNTYHEVCRFTVTLKWPPYCERLPEEFIRKIIEEWKPAHTTHQLELA